MKYSVNLRMKNPGPAKFLIETCDADELVAAFCTANKMRIETDDDHFVEIVDNESGQMIAQLN